MKTIHLRLTLVALAVAVAQGSMGSAEAQQTGCQHQVSQGACDSFTDAGTCAMQIQRVSAVLQRTLDESPRGTRFLALPQADDPATLSEITHSVDHVFLRGALRNCGDEPLISVRIGRITIDADRRVEMLVGDSTPLLEPLPGHGAMAVVGTQHLLGSADQLLARNVQVAVFFVAEIAFASGGVWKADPGRLSDQIGLHVPAR